MALTIGTQLGSHEITALLGKGGMGEVYRARDLKLKREVAVKVLPDHLSQDADRLSRFQREAEVLASLNHPNVAHVYGLEQSGQIQFIIMELVDGETLQERLARGAMPAGEALAVAAQVAEALEAAHERGIIHRDLKPANIKIAPDGRVKVLDFGLAKVFDRNQPDDLSNSPTLMSASVPGVILGTAAYMSPEQAKGGSVDQRTDIFAFGCVLFEMLTGRQAFQGDSVSEVLASVLKTNPDFDALPADLSVRLKDLLRRCLEKNPRNRLHAAADVRIELQSIVNASPEADRRPATPRRNRVVSVTAAVATIFGILLGGLAVWQWKPSPVVAVARFTLPLPEIQQPSFFYKGIEISRDGTQIVYEGNRRLYLRSISESSAKPIAGTEDAIGATSPEFSPDGRSIVFVSLGDHALKVVPANGGTASTVAHIDPLGLAGLSWSTSGIVFSQGLKSIAQVSAHGGEPKTLVTAGTSEYVLFPELLPDGKNILFCVEPPGSAHDLLVVQSLATGERKVLVDSTLAYVQAHYVPTGHIVYHELGRLFAMPFDLKTLKSPGNPIPVIQGVMQTGLGQGVFSISETGSLIYMPGHVSADSTNLGVSDRDGVTKSLNLPARNYRTPRTSPDGKRIAFEVESGADQNIWIYDVSGQKAPNRLTFGGKNRYPVWSGDSRQIAFQSDREGDLAIFSQPADGGGVALRLTKPEKGVEQAPESWSPDSATILFRAIAAGPKVSLWSFSLRDKQAAPFGGVESPDPTDAVFSPDGKWVAYHIRDSNRGLHEVYVQPFPATGARYQLPIPRDNHHPVWARGGKEIIYIAGPGEFASVTFSATPGVAFGNPVQLRSGVTTAAPTAARQHDVTPDGKILGQVASASAQDGTPGPPQISVVLNWFSELQQRVPVK
jgi:serine/threonine-protein kinase